jgi:S-DNA-T family DNA segregation ATPase FtsK/SpoIIIE
MPEASGKVGSVIGLYNRVFFGYLAFVYPYLLIIPAYFVYKDPHMRFERTRIWIPAGILFVAILMFQAKVVNSSYLGIMGSRIDTFLTKYVGSVGIWVVIFGLLLTSAAFLANATIENFTFSFGLKDYFRRIKDETLEKIEDFRNYIRSHLGFLHRKEETIDFDVPDTPLEEVVPPPKKSPVVVPVHEEESVEDDVLEFHNSIEEIIGQDATVQESTSVSARESMDDTLQALKEETKELEMLVGQVSTQKKPVAKTVAKSKAAKPKTKLVTEIKENKKHLAKTSKNSKINKPKNFKLPYLDFLESAPKKKFHINEAEIDQKIVDLMEKLAQFKITGDVVATYSGPVVTTFEFRPDAHIKVSKILTLQDDLAMALKAQTIRIQAPVPGKDVVGIEIPNSEISTIYLKEILQSPVFQKAESSLTMAVGKDIVGNPFVTDLKKLPHLLIAGTTGSGKSVGINAMLVSLLYRNSPDDLKLLMIDPKMLEFSIYNDIPHLLTPVITQAKQAIVALANMVVEMEKRYKLMSKTKTKNIENYNEKAKREGYDPFPYIVVIIDELADLMMTSGKDVEFYIARLAQMARASGIHLIVATQRPSVDVVTGLIKANLPSRISFKVGQKIDSKVILDSTGAESLLGRGDMLFTPPGTSGLIRLHAPFISEEEIETIVEFLKSQREVVYDESFLNEPGSLHITGAEDVKKSAEDDFDELYEEAKSIVLSDKKTSISYLQRRLQIGYNRAARIIEQLELTGVISAPNAKGQREILV